jgi:hypothetical protein
VCLTWREFGRDNELWYWCLQCSLWAHSAVVWIHLKAVLASCVQKRERERETSHWGVIFCYSSEAVCLLTDMYFSGYWIPSLCIMTLLCWAVSFTLRDHASFPQYLIHI